VSPPGKKQATKKKKAKKNDGNEGSDDDGGDSVGTLVTIALQINAGKLQEIPAPVPKSKKGNKGMYTCVAVLPTLYHISNSSLSTSSL
jgi:hypothetical protein